MFVRVRYDVRTSTIRCSYEYDTMFVRVRYDVLTSTIRWAHECIIRVMCARNNISGWRSANEAHRNWWRVITLPFLLWPVSGAALLFNQQPVAFSSGIYWLAGNISLGYHVCFGAVVNQANYLLHESSLGKRKIKDHPLKIVHVSDVVLGHCSLYVFLVCLCTIWCVNKFHTQTKTQCSCVVCSSNLASVVTFRCLLFC